MNSKEQLYQMINYARNAQKEFESFSQEEVDLIVKASAKAVYDNSELLARLAFDESKMGKYEDIMASNLGRSKTMWYYLKGKKSRGILRNLDDCNIVEVGKPIGVIGAVTPVTAPTIVPLHNILVSLKGGNSIIISPHPKAKITAKKTVSLINDAIEKLGAPKHLVQIIEEPTMEISSLLMQNADVCISTGGAGVVKVAYRSGRPAFGVGAGNVQCLIDRDADIQDAVEKIIASASSNNGVYCSCEEFVLCPREMYADIASTFQKLGAYYCYDPIEVSNLRKIAFPNGSSNNIDLVGKSAPTVAKAAGISAPDDVRLIAVKVDAFGEDELLAKEKLFPVVSLYPYDTWEQAVEIAEQNLTMEGKGHSITIHSNTKSHIEYAANHVSVSRFAVNMGGTKSLSGTMTNGLAPSATLGCGSWGNNSISENLDYKHLMNISRIVYEIKDIHVPTDEEIWS